MNTAIDIQNISHDYGGDGFVLKNLSLCIQRGDFFIIIGPNGSGKTTLMKAIAGLLKPKQGNLKILGLPIESYSRKILAKTVAFVPQMTTLDFPFTVTEVVLMGRSPHLGILGLEHEKDLEIAHQAISFTGVEHLADRKIDQLSGGEKQRVFIARAICQEPQIILLDEPTASLDLAHQIRTMDLMEQLKKEKKITVVMVSHDVNLAAMYSEKLLLLKDGEIASLGFPKEVLTYQKLEEVYGCKLLVDKSDIGNFPRITLIPRKFINSDKKSRSEGTISKDES